MQIGQKSVLMDMLLASWAAVITGMAVAPAMVTCSTITWLSPSSLRLRMSSLTRSGWARSSVTMKSVRFSWRTVSAIRSKLKADQDATRETCAPTMFRP